MNSRCRLALFALAVGLPMGAVASGTGPGAAPDGARIVEENCATCHAAGVMGSPKIGDAAAWQARLKAAGSVAGLLATTQHGKGNMPPRGGEPSLTDAELQSAIEYMLRKSGGAS